MKNLHVFTLLFVTSFSASVSACGYYPYGEDIRFCFTHPTNFGYRGFSEFNYTSWNFYPNTEGVYNDNEVQPNTKIWFDYCKSQVAIDAILEGVYQLNLDEINPKSTNKLLQYLYQIKDNEAINYLKFAKSVEIYNQQYTDPWERNESISIPDRAKAIEEAIDFSRKTNVDFLKKRYIFQAIRLAYYNGESEKIVKLFDTTFLNSTNKDIIYYWSLYFRTIIEKDAALQSFYAAQVFANAPDKRFAVFYDFNNQIDINLILKNGKTNVELSNVYSLAAIRKFDKVLPYIQKVYALNPENESISFLLLREINKIEDWIFTPYFTFYEPSIVVDRYENYPQDFSLATSNKRITLDRRYAHAVLKFVNSVAEEKVKKPLDFKIFKIQLLFATEKYKEALNQIAAIEESLKDNELLANQVQITKALCITAKHSSGNAIITPEVAAVLLKNKSDSQFVFAIARLLEMKGNTTDAALLFSAIDKNEDYMTWKSSKNKTQSYGDYFYNYFQYIDVIYTTQQVKDLIADVEVNGNKKDSFSIWKYALIKNEISRLYDLLGTQYIRKNELKTALFYFEKVTDKHWESYYGLWHRQDNNGNYFDENPFYTLKYTPDFIDDKENFILNKKTVTAKLIQYLEKAQDKKEPNRDLYYFLVANCYYNMTINGNAWMMRRYGVSANDVEPYHEDENEFRNGDLAKKYYELANKNAKTVKFKALCLRLTGKMDGTRIANLDWSGYKGDSLQDVIFEKNNFYKKLQKAYPDNYDDLIYGCSAFEDYFKARR